MNEPDLRAALLRVAAGRSTAVVPNASTWSEWETLTARERVWPLLYQLVERVPTDLSDPQRLTIQSRQELAQSQCVTLEHNLIAVATKLTRSGIRSAVLKGAATAHVDYPDPAWRDFADIDVLVDVENMARATELLLTDGWTQRYALPRGHERYTHAITFVRHGVELDMHQRLGHRALGLRVPTGDLLDSTEKFEIAGVRLSALGAHDRLIHSSIHAVSSRWPNRRLSSVADVLLGAELRPRLAGEVLERAERWRVRPFVERAVVDAYAAAQIELKPEWLAAMRHRVQRRDRLVERAYLGSERHPVIEELAFLRLMPSWSTRWQYLRGYFSVGPEYTAQHGRAGFASQARYALGKLRSRE